MELFIRFVAIKSQFDVFCPFDRDVPWVSRNDDRFFALAFPEGLCQVDLDDQVVAFDLEVEVFHCDIYT